MIKMGLVFITILTASAEERVHTSVVRVLESAQVPMAQAVYLKDVALFEGFEPAYLTALENVKVADSGEQYGKMSSQELMSQIRPSIKNLEAVCNCKISLNLPRSLQNHTLQGDFTLAKTSDIILKGLRSQCTECEYYMDDLKISQGSVPAVYSSWELDGSVKNLRGHSVISVYFDKKALEPLVLNTVVRIKRPVLRLTRAQSLGAVVDSNSYESSMADVTFENKKIAQLSDLENSELARALPSGQILFVDDLRALNIVRHGQPLSVEIAHGAFHIKISGVAQRNGRLGEKIPVRVNKTRKDIVAEVVGEGRVRMQR